MKISHYFEWEEHMTGGHVQSVKNQRKILEDSDIQYTTRPNLSHDILHLNNFGPKSFWYARKAKNKQDITLVISAHQTSEDLKNSFILSNFWSKPVRPYLKKMYRYADRIICPSKHTEELISSSYAPRSRTEVISNGFNHSKLEGYKSLRQEYRSKYGLSGKTVFCVGHVLRRKGLEYFISAAEENPGTDFIWFGFLNPTGKGKASVLQGYRTKKMIEQSPENCTFTGYIDDIRGGFAAGDIFFFPTKNENEGISLLEAMSCRKPCITSSIDAFDRYEDEVHCLKSQPGEYNRQIQRLLEDADLRQRLAENAHSKSKQYSLSSVSSHLTRFYRNCTEEGN